MARGPAPPWHVPNCSYSSGLQLRAALAEKHILIFQPLADAVSPLHHLLFQPGCHGTASLEPQPSPQPGVQLGTCLLGVVALKKTSSRGLSNSCLFYSLCLLRLFTDICKRKGICFTYFKKKKKKGVWVPETCFF